MAPSATFSPIEGKPLYNFKRRSSLEVFKGEVPLWRQTHPLKPIIPLLFKLLRILLISGPQWIFRAFRLIIFVICMLPAFFVAFQYYLGSTSVIRNLKYGSNPRNYLDIILPQTDFQAKRPVLIFLTGGIWLIGYKAWGIFMAKVLSAFGVVVVLPDYRNFPQGTVGDMLDDVDESLNWVVRNIEQFGGDRDAIFLTGQSAGAHLGLLTILRKARREHEELVRTKESQTLAKRTGHGWDTSNIAAFIGISGPYNVKDLMGIFSSRGMSTTLLRAIMGGEDFVGRFSADHVVDTEPEFCSPEVTKRVPPVVLLHGTADLCVPFQATRKTAEALAGKGIKTYMRFYPGKTHTDAIIEDLVYAEDPCKEDMMTDIVTIVLAKKQVSSVLHKVTYEIKGADEPPSENEPRRRSLSHSSFSETPDSVELSYSSSEEFEVQVDSEEDILRPSFLTPQIQRPQDFDLKHIRRSILPWALWRFARFANPF